MTEEEHRRAILVLSARIAEEKWQAAKTLERIKKLEAAKAIHVFGVQQAVVREGKERVKA